MFLCSGQSNMELPMAWVRADYPQEWDRDPDPLLRQYKVIPDYDSKVLATITTVRSGRAAMRIRLMISQRSHISSDAGSVSGWMCRRLLNVSLGGSPIESWMDADALRRSRSAR